MIDLNASPTPNLDLETPNVVQKPSPSPVPTPTNEAEQAEPVEPTNNSNHLPTA